MSSEQAIPDTSLGLSNEDIALLRRETQIAASNAGGSSSRAASRASSQGLLLLNGSSLAALYQHFDSLLLGIDRRIQNLSEDAAVAAQQQNDWASNAIQMADAEIARFHDIMRQIDELELEYNRLAQIKTIVADNRRRVEEMEKQLEQSGGSGRQPHGGSSRSSRKLHGESSGSSKRHHHHHHHHKRS